jgi:hypothetical protein
MEPIIIESCRSTWIFETGRGLFRRVLKETEADPHRVVTPWRRYYGLVVDPDSESFVVLLNPGGTRLWSSWRHVSDCPQCGGHATAELCLDDIRMQAHSTRQVSVGTPPIPAGSGTMPARPSRTGAGAT